MRLQLILLFLPPILACSAQDFSSTDSVRKQRSIGPVDVDFLFSYYNQDGNHSPVTGGIGTEKLEDYATKIIVNIPLDSLNALLFNVGFNYYSSASTDKIDRRISSASSKDSHAQMEMEYSRKNLKRHYSFSLGIGGSIESDYTSSYVSAGWQKESVDRNRSFGMKASAFFDHWRLFFPDELRDSVPQFVKTDKRRTFSLALTYSQTLNKRLQAALILEGVYQYGLLATPFHRVYFRDEPVPKVETLPGNRFKFPIAIRANYFLGDFLIFRFYYRFYVDDFGIIGNTANLEIPVKIIPAISVSPFYRFYYQTKSDYFREFAQHEASEEFFTSDYDLSAFFSHKVGVGLSYNPGEGVRKLTGIQAQKKIKFKNVGVRYANYFRSDGLRAFMASIGISFSL